MELKDLEKEIENIKIRNARVELNKKWETCWTRKICICVLTYIVPCNARKGRFIAFGIKDFD